MSDNNLPPSTENNLDEAEDAFIDLEDPNLEVINDPDDANKNEEERVSSADDNDSADGVPNEEDAGDDGLPQQDAEVVDLNAEPDREPERDDALATFSTPGGEPIHAVVTHPKNPLLVAASGEAEKVFILQFSPDLHSVQLLHTLEGHTDTVSLLSFSPNGEWLASGSLDSTVGLWSTATWERKHTLTDLYGEITALLWHPSSLVMVAGTTDEQAAMWNVAQGTLINYFVGHRGAVTSCVWSPDNKKLVTGSNDGSVIVFNPKTGEKESNVSKDLSPDNAGITALLFINADQCIVGCEDGTLHVVSLSGGKVVAHLEDLHTQAVESLQVNESATLFLTSSCDRKVIIWNASDFSSRAVLEVVESVIPALWAEKHLVVAGCSDGNVRIWDGRSTVQEPQSVLMGHRRMVLSLCTLPATEGTTPAAVVSAGDDGMVKAFALSSGAD